MLPIALPRKNEKLKPGAAATATGWGALKVNSLVYFQVLILHIFYI